MILIGVIMLSNYFFVVLIYVLVYWITAALSFLLLLQFFIEMKLFLKHW